MKNFLITLFVFALLRQPLFGAYATCSWAPVTKYVSGTTIPADVLVKYKIYRSTSVLLSNPVLVSDTTSTLAVDTTIIRKVRYYYWVVAYVAPDGKLSDKSTIRSIRKMN